MIRVAMTSKLSQKQNDAITYFNLAIILSTGNLTKTFTGAFFSNMVTLMFVKFKQNLSEQNQDILERRFYRKKYGKKRKMLMYGRYLQKTKRFSHAISPHSSFNLFKNVCERSWRQLCPITRKKDLISMYRGTLVSAFVNILVYFNRLVTNFKPNDRLIFLKEFKFFS